MDSRPRLSRSLTARCAAVLLLCMPAAAQGRTDYLNFESPVVRPITVASIGSSSYLLVCNTPDNSVEIYDTCNDDRFVLRVPTGLEPVSVVHAVVDSEDRLYTTNWLGDSVTCARLIATANPSAPLAYEWLYTVPVGDEPMDLIIAPGNNMVVTLGQSLAPRVDSPGSAPNPPRASVVWHDAATGAPLTNSQWVITEHDWLLAPDDESDFFNNGEDMMILKQPRTIEIIPGVQGMAVLGTQGGGGADSSNDFDFDVWWKDFTNPPGLDDRFVAGLGTTNFNMAFSSERVLWVVSLDARSEETGNATLSQLDTGFAETLLHRIPFDPILAGGAPAPLTRDLNEDGTGTAVDPRTASLAHATDVLVYEPAGVTDEIVCVAGFNSDRVGFVTNTGATTAAQWNVQAIDVDPSDPDGDDLWGPRALALKEGAGDCSEDRIYVFNSLAHSVTVIDPGLSGSTLNPTVESTFPLQHDPVPAYIRDGRKFLYATVGTDPGGTRPEFGHGFNSCASCHIDARSDQLLWTLTDEPNVSIPSPLSVFEVSDPASVFSEFPTPKGPLVTQSLQGLVDSEMGGNGFGLTSNAPYHWRGDKPSFLDFNEAFEGLLGAVELPAADMEAFEAFINSVHYPPNPGQPEERTYSGALGDPNVVRTVAGPDGSGAQRGLKLFHILPTPPFTVSEDPLVELMLFAGRSCVQCHTLPVGSNNRITTISGGNPLESAALRGMRQKESTFELFPTVDGLAVPPGTNLLNGDFGMGHEGETGRSIVEFHEFLAKDDDPVERAEEAEDLTDINAYIREFDTGVAPMVGRMVEAAAGSSFPTAEVGDMEAQVHEANIGLAVRYQQADGTLRGFWYRIAGAGGGYEEVGIPGVPVDPSTTLGSGGGRMLFIATPLGSERRIASPTGVGLPAYPAGPIPSPSNVEFVGTSPNTANEDITQFVDNWVEDSIILPPAGVDLFDWTGTVGGNPVEVPRTLKAMMQMQEGLASEGVAVGHDAPRRLQVIGDDLYEGCRLRIHVKMRGSKTSTPPFSPAGNFDKLVLPLYPTTVQVEGKTVWETAVEFDPLTLYTLLLGGPRAPGVDEALGPYDLANPPVGNPPPSFDPANWNLVKVEAKNQAGSWVLQAQSGSGAMSVGFQPLVY